MTINKIEVSLFPSECALSKYLIKHPTIIFEKRLILVWRVTYFILLYTKHYVVFLTIFIYLCKRLVCVSHVNRDRVI